MPTVNPLHMNSDVVSNGNRMLTVHQHEAPVLMFILPTGRSAGRHRFTITVESETEQAVGLVGQHAVQVPSPLGHIPVNQAHPLPQSTSGNTSAGAVSRTQPAQTMIRNPVSAPIPDLGKSDDNLPNPAEASKEPVLSEPTTAYISTLTSSPALTAPINRKLLVRRAGILPQTTTGSGAVGNSPHQNPDSSSSTTDLEMSEGLRKAGSSTASF